MKEGSPELTDIFAREVVCANDTSAAVGYAPLTETERLVLETEHWLNSPVFARKEEMRLALTDYLASKLQSLDEISVQLNTLDDPSRGEGDIYLTVLGTSAEGGDCGQVGKGNRVNGVIPLNRPISNEAAAGKNPISHVGKIYSLLTHHIANEVVQRDEGVEEVYIWLCSQIGQPIDKPMIAASQVKPTQNREPFGTHLTVCH